MRNGTRTLRHPPPPKPRPVLTNRSFLLLWLAQLISQSAQNAILFTLLVLPTFYSFVYGLRERVTQRLAPGKDP